MVSNMVTAGDDVRINRLTARQIETAKLKEGQDRCMLADGGNLLLQVTRKSGGGFNKSWVFRYEIAGTRRDMGLGSLDTFSLSEARDKARALRQQIHGGIDPLAQQRAEHLAQRTVEAKTMTFRECAVKCISAHEDSWRNAEHRRQWTSTLDQYVYPIIGDLSVAEIDTPHIIKTLEPIWKDKTETAKRVRGRIEKVLGWAQVRGFRGGDNPARWRGHLQELFAAKGKAEHHDALPYADVPAFMVELGATDHPAAHALAFTILTAARAGETLGATWDEIDFAAKVWTVPAARMKAGKEHRVPLSDRAIEILRSLPRTDARVFPGYAKGMLRLLKGLRPDATVHGFRSSFRDWAAERTNYPREVAEAALAHAIPNAVEAAYRRTDFFERRRKLMEAWAEWVSRPVPTGATVMALGGQNLSTAG
jgi:integrase